MVNVSWTITGSDRSSNISLETTAPWITRGGRDVTVVLYGCVVGADWCILHAPSRRGTPPQTWAQKTLKTFVSGLLWGCWVWRAGPQSLRGRAWLATLSFTSLTRWPKCLPHQHGCHYAGHLFELGHHCITTHPCAQDSRLGWCQGHKGTQKKWRFSP